MQPIQFILHSCIFIAILHKVRDGSRPGYETKLDGEYFCKVNQQRDTGVVAKR